MKFLAQRRRKPLDLCAEAAFELGRLDNPASLQRRIFGPSEDPDEFPTMELDALEQYLGLARTTHSARRYDEDSSGLIDQFSRRIRRSASLTVS